MTEAQLKTLEKKIPALFDEYIDQFDGMHGLGISLINDDVPALTFFVIPNSDAVIPGELIVELNGTDESIPTRRIDSPEFKFQACYCKYVRPAKGGNCISPISTGAVGTIGGIVISPTQERHFITAGHLFINKKPGEKIVQPSGSSEEFASLKYCVKWEKEMKSDAAIAEVVAGQNISEIISDIGTPKGPVKPAKGVKVRKSGTMTCLTTSDIDVYPTTVTIDGYKFDDVFTTTESMSEAGDSGALIIDKDKNIRGVLIGGNGQSTVACNIMNVIKDLKLDDWKWHDELHD